MLEFYSVHRDRQDPIIGVLPLFAAVYSQRVSARNVALAVAFALLLAGCATAPIGGPQAPAAQPTLPPLPRTAEPPPPPVNLSGFPLPYRQGYSDGCSSSGGAERKDAARFASDPNYRTGWTDGLALCRRK
jgi:hypothetical protein